MGKVKQFLKLIKFWLSTVEDLQLAPALFFQVTTRYAPGPRPGWGSWALCVWQAREPCPGYCLSLRCWIYIYFHRSDMKLPSTIRFKELLGLGGLCLQTSSAGIVGMLCPPFPMLLWGALGAIPSHFFFPFPNLHLLNSFILDPAVAGGKKNTSKWAGGGVESAGDDTADEEHLPGSGREEGKHDWGAQTCGLCWGGVKPENSNCYTIVVGLP